MPGTEFSRISVLIPTRGRVERLRTLIESFERTASGSAELVFRVDEDDVRTQEFLAGQKVLVGPRMRGYTSLPWFFNELLTVADGDVLMCGNDDMVFVTPRWDALILDAANEYPDGLFDFGVETHNSPNFPFATVSRKAVDAMGFIFDTRFFWGDIFLRDVMSYFGRAIPLPGVRIDHDWAGFNPDRTFTSGNNTRWTVSGEYHAQAVSEAIHKLGDL